MGNKDQADLIFINGNILTMDEEMSQANSVVVRNGTVQFVGDQNEALAFEGEQTEIIDLQGKTMMPGFIESHIHPTLYGLNLLKLDCRPENTPSIDALLKKIEEAVQETPDGEWVIGWGWDDSKLLEKRAPTRWELDRVAPDHPVFLTRTCAHMAVVNTKALKLSGVSAETEDPDGGHIERDPQSGEITGLLQEKAQGLIALPKEGVENLVAGMKLAQKDFAKWGITTIHDMSTQTAEMQVYQHLLNEDALTVRVRPWIWAIAQNDWTGHLDEVLSLGIRSGFGNDMIKIQGMKFMLDGSVGGRTAAVAEPYENDSSKGILYSEVDDVAPAMEKSLSAGLRVAIHGIGERAIEVAIQAFEKANEKVDITSMRNRIEHCALPTENHLKRMKKLELIAASSIGFLYHIGDSYMNNLGPERMKRVYPHKSFKEYGLVAPGNSDLPVTGGNPWTGIYAAVTRKTVSGQVLDTTQNISVEDALKAYTNDAAYSSCEEKTIGVIKPFAKADLIVIAEDPFKVDAEQLKEIEVEQTYMDGNLVYAKEENKPDLDRNKKLERVES